MKKVMMIALLLSVFFSCTEVLDEFEVDQDIVDVIKGDSTIVDQDTTIVDQDTTIVDEDTISQDSPQVDNGDIDFSSNKYIGLHVSKYELDQWRQRSITGPYKSKGDFVTNSPGEWERLIEFTNNFKSNPEKDLWDGSRDPEPYMKHHELLSAAFISLVNNDKELASLVKNQLIKQSKIVNTGKLTFVNEHKGFHTANWYLRLLYAYDYIKGYCTEQERQTLDSWLYEAATFYANNTHNVLKRYFPNRLNEDYSAREQAASNAGFKEGEYAFVDQNGKMRNQIYWIHKQYNNRIASKIRLVALVGIFLDNPQLIHHGKIFVKELLKFGVFPDGTMGEYERNGDYGSPQTGAMYYGCINIEVAMNIADALSRKGDNELYNYTTSEGIYGTEGGNKNIKLMINAYMENITGKVKRYYNSVAKTNLIDFNDETQDRRYIAYDIIFSQAHRVYQNDYIEECFLRKHSTAPAYPSNKFWHAVNAYWPWSGPTATLPSYAFMFAGIDYSQNNQ